MYGGKRCWWSANERHPHTLRIHILRLAIAERPVLPRNFDKIDYQIPWAQAGRLRKDFRHAFEQRTLLLRFPAHAESDLHEDDTIRPRNAKIVGRINQIPGRMLRN